MSNSRRITLRPIDSIPALGFPLPRSCPPASASVTLAQWLDIWMAKDNSTAVARGGVTRWMGLDGMTPWRKADFRAVWSST